MLAAAIPKFLQVFVISLRANEIAGKAKPQLASTRITLPFELKSKGVTFPAA
jgi:hypothetical protein|tara:strand:+ start:324 stop:479 length:156 start_codon:yes stop_codon:yes gene_type:complete